MAGLSRENLAVEVYDFMQDNTKAESLGIDKIPAVAILGVNSEERRI